MRSCIDGKLSVPYKEILVIVKQNTKELRQSNVNLTKSIFEMLSNICEIVYSLALPLEVWLCKIIVPVVVEKIADRKLADIPSSILLKICELALPDKIIPLAIKKISEIKSPLYHEAFLKWILKFFSEFGAHALSSGVQEIANWCLKVSLLSICSTNGNDNLYIFPGMRKQQFEYKKSFIRNYRRNVLAAGSTHSSNCYLIRCKSEVSARIDIQKFIL